MTCPQCNEKMRVILSRKVKGKTYRYKRCPICKYKEYSVEVPCTRQEYTTADGIYNYNLKVNKCVEEDYESKS